MDADCSCTEHTRTLFSFWLSAYQSILYATITCVLSRHHMSLHLSQALISAWLPPRGREYPDWADEVTQCSYQRFALDLMSGNTSGGIGRSLIYRDAITFINACLIKWLARFNLILPLANYHRTHEWAAVCALWETFSTDRQRKSFDKSVRAPSCVVSASHHNFEAPFRPFPCNRRGRTVIITVCYVWVWREARLRLPWGVNV